MGVNASLCECSFRDKQGKTFVPTPSGHGSVKDDGSARGNMFEADEQNMRKDHRRENEEFGRVHATSSKRSGIRDFVASKTKNEDEASRSGMKINVEKVEYTTPPKEEKKDASKNHLNLAEHLSKHCNGYITLDGSLSLSTMKRLAEDEDGCVRLEFSTREKLGMCVSENNAEDGIEDIRVTRIQAGGQADRLGVRVGWRLLRIGDYDLSPDFTSDEIRKIVADSRQEGSKIPMSFAQPVEIEESIIPAGGMRKLNKAEKKARKVKMKITRSGTEAPSKTREKTKSMYISDLPELDSIMEKRTSWGMWQKKRVKVQGFALLYAKKAQLLDDKKVLKQVAEDLRNPMESSRSSDGGVTMIPLSVVDGISIDRGTLVIHCRNRRQLTFRPKAHSNIDIKEWKRIFDIYLQFYRAVMSTVTSGPASPTSSFRSGREDFRSTGKSRRRKHKHRLKL